MRITFRFLSKATLALMIPAMFMFSSCSEDVVDPTSSMPPKNEIVTPPRKN